MYILCILYVKSTFIYIILNNNIPYQNLKPFNSYLFF